MNFFRVAVLLLIVNVSFGQDTLLTLNLEEVAISAIRASKKAPVPFTNFS